MSLIDFPGERAIRERREVREPRIKLVPFDQVKLQTEHRHLIKGLIPATGLVVVWGPPKCGKSFWVTDAVMHNALGWQYRGRRGRQGPVVYCAMEGASGYGARLEAFRQRHLTDNATAIPFYLVASPMTLVRDRDALVAAIKAQLGDEKPVVIVLDTLNRSIGGSESDDRDMAAYIAAADALWAEFNCAIVIVHHCGIDASRPRGHTSLTGAADAQLSVKRDAAANVVVTIEWMKDGPDGDQIVSRLEQVEVGVDEDGEPITSCVVVPVEGEPAASDRNSVRMTKAAKIALRALNEAISECGEPAPASNHIPPNVTVVTLDRWRQYAYRRGISASEQPRAKQQAFKRASEDLIASQAVAIWDERAWLTS